jgi:hypothetical protein
MKSLLAVAAVAATLANAPANAVVSGEIAGDMWLQECTSKQVSFLFKCAGYTRGLADGLRTAAALLDANDNRKWLVCAPDDVATQQLVDVGVSYMQRSPTTRHNPAAILLPLAWAEAWPCRS